MQKIYFGLGTAHRTYEDAISGENPMTQEDVDAVCAANEAERKQRQESLRPLACAACGKTGNGKTMTRGPQGEPDVAICYSFACYRQWNLKRTYFSNR